MDEERKYIVKAVWSSKLTTDMIRDFCFACNTVFGGNMTEESFRKKYVENIYGDSVICVVYDENGCTVGARALWRNDIDGKRAFQPCDTCVLKQYRGQKIFEKMTAYALDMISTDDVIYNFPNANSRRLYLKLGWTVNGEYKPRFWKGYKAYISEHPERMSDEYFNWWVKEKCGDKYMFLKKGGKYYLVKNRGKFLRMVTAEISAKTACQLRKASGFRLLVYLSKTIRNYNKNHESYYVLYKSKNDIKIPTWKVDVI